MSESRYEALLQRSLQTVRTLKARVAELEGAGEAIAIVGSVVAFPAAAMGRTRSSTRCSTASMRSVRCPRSAGSSGPV